MSAARSRPRRRDIVVVVLLLVGLLGGTVLVVVGDNTSIDPTSATGSSLPLDQVSMEQVARWSGLAIPAGAANFLTARVGDSQLDVTFTMADSEVDEFLRLSALPQPEPGARLILHSSPLWKLNPGSDAAQPDPSEPASPGSDPAGPETTATPPPEIYGTAGVFGGVNRTVELYQEALDVVRARIVLTPAP